jgi:hypothetical protein
MGLKFPVCVSWYYLKRDNGKKETRFVLSTKPLKATTITWWGRRRWQIEGWFKTAKHRARLAPLWSGYSPGSLPLVSPLAHCLYFVALGLFIHYPSDLGLLNQARIKTEKIIDILYEPLKEN